MADYQGALGAQTFALPQVQPYQPPVTQPLNDGIVALEGLQHANGLANEYYQKVAALKAFMQDVNANYNLDVRVPDMSRPESLKLNEIYRTALADIMAQGNLLKTSQSDKALAMQMGMIPATGVDFNEQPFSTLSQNKDFYNRNVETPVTEINNKLQMPSQTQEEQDQKEQIYRDAIAKYDRLAKENPESRDYYEYQKRGITPPTKGMFRPSQESYYDRRFGRRVQAAGEVLKKLTNLLHGAHNSYSPDSTRHNNKGNPLLVSKELYGMNLGKSPIGDVIFDPDTHKVTITFQDGTTPIDATSYSRDPQYLASSIFNIEQEAISKYIQDHEHEDEYGQLKTGDLLAKDYEKLRDSKKKESSKLAETTGPAVEEMENYLTRMESGWFTDDVKDFGPYRIKRKSDKFVIVNANQIPVPPKYKGKDAQAFQKKLSEYPATELGRKGLIKFLVRSGVHTDMYEEAHATQGELDQAGGAPAPIKTTVPEPTQTGGVPDNSYTSEEKALFKALQAEGASVVEADNIIKRRRGK